MKFQLDDQQIEKLEEFQERVKQCFGAYGLYSYTFTPVGIGTVVEVKSHLSGWTIDISMEENW